jgi:hypothetical protein
MSGAVGGSISGSDRIATTEYEPPVQPTLAVQPVQTAPAVQPVQAAPAIQPVQPVLAVQPVRPAVIEDQGAPEIPVSEYADTQGQNAQAYPQFLKSAAPTPSSQSSHLGVKMWLKTAFRRTSKGQKEDKNRSGAHSPFVGGASLTQPDGIPPVTTDTAIGQDGTAQEVPVSRYLMGTEGSRHSNQDESNVGMVSNSVEETVIPREGDYEEESEEARDQFNDADVAMPVFKSQRPLSPARDSRFREVI